MSVRFTQCCPTCGRRIQIRATLLGCTVACQHCQAEFVAEPETPSQINPAEPSEPNPAADPLMARVEELLAQSSQDPVG